MISRVSTKPTSTSSSTPRSRYPRRNGLRRPTGSHLPGQFRSASARRAPSSRKWRRSPASMLRRTLRDATSRLPWYSRSVNSTYLTGKRVFVFGDATHAIAAARVARAEFGFRVVGLGTYSREFAREVREAAEACGAEALITDDYLEVEAKVARIATRTGARHPDGAPHRQAARHSLRRDFGACSRSGFSGSIFAADGLRRRERPVRFLGSSADDGSRRASPDDVPRGPEFHDGAPPSHLGAKARVAPPMRPRRRRPSMLAPPRRSLRPQASRTGVRQPGARTPRKSSRKFRSSCAVGREEIPRGSRASED